MRVWLALAGFSFGLWALATPFSWHTLDPQPNPYGWHNTPVTVTIDASGGQNLRVCYRLNGAGPSTGFPSVILNFSEGIHTLEYWAEDESGEERPHHFLTLRLDFTPPRLVVRVPERNKRYLLNENVLVDWFAYDSLSGVEFADAPARPGEPLDTSSPGFQTFRVFARDFAGNSASLEVEYQNIFLIDTVFPNGFFLNRLLSAEEQRQVGTQRVLARYGIGESILFAFLLKDALGQAYTRAGANVLLAEVRFTEEGERHTIWDWRSIPYDPDKGFYFLAYPTEKRKPGLYDLWISFGDGQSQRIRVELVPGEGGEGT